MAAPIATILGLGRPGMVWAEALAGAGFALHAGADRIPARRDAFKALAPQAQVYDEYAPAVDAGLPGLIVVALPTDLHLDAATRALKRGAHVLLETPGTRSASELRKLIRLAEKSRRQVIPALVRRFGPAEQAAHQALTKQLIGEVRHVRAAWLRTRGTPAGTGWYTDPARAGGGALLDLGLPLLDLLLHLLDRPALEQAHLHTHPRGEPLEQSAFGLLRLARNAEADPVSVEFSVAWQLDQPPGQQGLMLRVHGSAGCLDVYTRQGAVLFRDFQPDGSARTSKLSEPKLHGPAAFARALRQLLQDKPTALPTAGQLLHLHETLARWARARG